MIHLYLKCYMLILYCFSQLCHIDNICTLFLYSPPESENTSGCVSDITSWMEAHHPKPKTSDCLQVSELVLDKCIHQTNKCNWDGKIRIYCENTKQNIKQPSVLKRYVQFIDGFPAG